MAKKGRKATKAEAQAGAKNLAKWKAENPEAANLAGLKHGAYSRQIKARYADGRTREAKELNAIMDLFVEALGGPENLTPFHSAMLVLLRPKIIQKIEFARYTERLDSIIDSKSEPLPYLKHDLQVSDSIRRDLLALVGYKDKPSHSSYKKAMKLLQGGVS